ncbi:MAG: hypothetical protein AAF682_24700 [Planctomycetota bacterium]
MVSAASTPAAGRTTTLRFELDGAPVQGSGLARKRYSAARLAQRADLLAPRGVGQILDAACDVFAARFGACFGVAFLLWFPTLFVESLLLSLGQDALFFGWGLIFPVLVQLFTSVFICSLVGGYLQGRFVSAGEAVTNGLHRFPGMIVLGGFTGVLTVLGMCSCFLPGILLAWLFSLVPAVYVLERTGMGETLGRAIKLVSSWPAFLRWAGWGTVGWMMVYPFASFRELMGVVPVRNALQEQLALGGLPFDLAVAAVGAPFLAIGTGYMAVVETVYYVDQRVRCEGLDLELRLRAVLDRHRGSEA